MPAKADREHKGSQRAHHKGLKALA